MVELLRYLEANGFVNYIVSGGDRDFMRVVTREMYGVPEERVVGSSSALRYTEDDTGGTIAHLAHAAVYDDGPAKAVRIWSRIGRRPILACGNSNADVEMLKFAGGSQLPALRLLLQHDDHKRDCAYRAGSERAFRLARAEGWIVSMRSDWKSVLG